MRTVFVNGKFVSEGEATVSIFDRGFLFADAVYEVTSVFEHKLVDFLGHLIRLRRSLSSIKISLGMSDDELLALHRLLIDRNALKEGLIYLQISRGVAERDFLLPEAYIEPTVVAFTQSKPLIDTVSAQNGIKVITVDDLRWHRCDIKTIQLLYSSLVKNEAKRRGADDAWLIRDGAITEGSSSNAYIVTSGDTLITRQLSSDILGGVTRECVLRCAAQLSLRVEERCFTYEEVTGALEAFATSASGLVTGVVSINGATIGTGRPGPVTKRLRELYIQASRANAI